MKNWLFHCALLLFYGGLAAGASAQEEFKPGEEFKDCAECPVMVVVPPGKFKMGATQAEHDNAPELLHPYLPHPQVKVSISQGFAVSKFEISYAEYYACLRDEACSAKPAEGRWREGPAFGLTWYDAKAYAAWLSFKTHQTYRLLTEAEWEYVARAGTNTRFWWGDQEKKNMAAYRACCETTSVEDLSVHEQEYRKNERDRFRVYFRDHIAVLAPLPRGVFPPNPFGVYDTSGNVSEWVEDCWQPGPNPLQATWSSHVAQGQPCRWRVIRGGNKDGTPDFMSNSLRWFADAAFKCRSRSVVSGPECLEEVGDKPVNREFKYIGIRIARDITK